MFLFVKSGHPPEKSSRISGAATPGGVGVALALRADTDGAGLGPEVKGRRVSSFLLCPEFSVNELGTPIVHSFIFPSVSAVAVPAGFLAPTLWQALGRWGQDAGLRVAEPQRGGGGARKSELTQGL